MQKSHYGFVLKVVPQNLHTIGHVNVIIRGNCGKDTKALYSLMNL